MISKRHISENLVFLLFILFIIIGIGIYDNVKITSYNNVYLLPIGFSVYTLFCVKLFAKLKSYFVFWLISLQQVVRYVVLPLLFIFEDRIKLGNETGNETAAIYIMLVELFIVYIVYNIVWFRSRKVIYKVKNLTFLPLNMLTFAVVVLFMTIITFSGPFLDKLNFIWDFSSYFQLQRADELDLEQVSPIVTIMFPMMRAYIVLYIFSLIYSFKIKQGKKLLLSVIIVILNATIIIGSSRFSIVYATFPLILILIYFYPSYKNKIIRYSFISSFLILIPASLMKYSHVSEVKGAGDFLSIYQLNAYFSGVVNNAIGYDSYEVQSMNFSERFKYLSSDILQNIPVLSRYSEDQFKTVIKFNREAYGNSISRDQIVPISISGLYHFSIYFFYIYLYIFILLAFRFERKSYYQNSPILFFIYISMAYTSASVMMINIGSMVSNLIVSGLFFVPLFKFLNLKNTIVSKTVN